MKVIKHGRNVHELQLSGKLVHVAMLSDIHWDNPHCDRDLLKKHLDFCKENNIPVIINGDFFCLMQGRGDNRRNKSDIRQEHNNARYLDSIVETAVEWFEPYADIIKVIVADILFCGNLRERKLSIVVRLKIYCYYHFYSFCVF